MSALLELRGVRREYSSGGGVFTALEAIDLAIHAGEYLAIVGPSGSGKSTLMNILGCLDRPTSGTYQVAGRSIAEATSDDLAELRRELFGFIFQRYNLLPDLTALGNVEVPAIYAGEGAKSRRERAAALLGRLKLDDRVGHFPGQLSGGQQQRVSIARALVNGGGIILADEPTGALDSHVGEEVLAVLKELHGQGHTIIVVTHDSRLAEHAERIIELRDGRIVGDRTISTEAQRRSPSDALSTRQAAIRRLKVAAHWERCLEALHRALRAMCAHGLRTILTMLGIIIGIASVVAVVALGHGTEQQVLRSINTLGTNTIDVYPGAGYGDVRADLVQTLRATDVPRLASLPFVDSATPGVSTAATIRYGAVAAHARVSGVGEQYFRVEGMRVTQGAAFDTLTVARADQSVVIDENVSKQLFGVWRESPIGNIILLDRVPFRIIGVVARSGNVLGGTGADLSVWVPYTTLMTRMLGQAHIASITVRVSDSTPMHAAEEGITRFLSRQHGRKDFFIQDTAQIREAIESATRTMTWFISAIAAISLLVGGIGVMNIMLVSVTERTREIGVRIAVGARRSDILRQFLIEAVLLCLIGGTLGVLLALGLGVAARHIANENFPMIFSADSIVVACVCSVLIGITFGFLPARNAARLDPIEALARE
jgi:macrolide transport system ATP-binding/permease protein